MSETDKQNNADLKQPNAEIAASQSPTGSDPQTGTGTSAVTVSSSESVPSHHDSEFGVEMTSERTTESLHPESVQVVSLPVAAVDEQTNRAKRSAMGMMLEISKLFIFPLLILVAFAGGIAMLGSAQRSGWLTSAAEMAAEETSQIGKTSAESNLTYICPMMCVPPTTEPGRCPVCGMELVKAATSSSGGPSTKIQIDPRSRRVAGIETVAARTRTLYREIRGVGEISFDETNLKTLSAYIDGRIEELYADYTGIEVKQGETLALLYSPDLYSAQVEYVKTLEFASTHSTSNHRVATANAKLLKSSRQRLIELGLTESQVDQLEKTKTAERRYELKAPISGTVIEKMAVTGKYVKAGEPIYRLADLSKVWLVLELFPEDAAAIQNGQKVIATTQSYASETFTGTVEFVEPTVDPKRRTIGVRVAITNPAGKLKPGEFARASLHVPLHANNGQPQETVVIPRNSLLSIGQTSLAYVETKPGEFELRHLKTGPTADGMTAVFEGIKTGEQVVARSTFLLDAQMQLQGNPSLMDPDKAVMPDARDKQLSPAELEEIRMALEPLSEADRKLVEAQVICPVTEVRLGSMGMGTPIKLEIESRTVFICCEGCRSGWIAAPEKYFKILDDYLSGTASDSTTSTGKEPTMPKMDLPRMELPKIELPKMKMPD